jgi:outer membrane protein assembly factor BamB
MSNIPPTAALDTGDSTSRLAAALEAYLADLRAGRPPDRQRVLAAYPDLAAQLDPCLAALEFIHRAEQPGPDGQPPPGGGNSFPVRLGDYRIVREIGRGGMGVVYEADQLSLRRRVALKVLRYGGPSDPEALARFRREAEVVGRLHHTNIVPVFAFGCEQSVHFYAMQLIEGRSLAAVQVERGGPLTPTEVAGWGVQAAEALAYAHARSIIHRDVKPSNLLLDGEGVLWLTDFGLARPAEETKLTASGLLVGTPLYMSPEQVAALPVDGRSDVYSLGATLYELATGRPVFAADNVPQLLERIRTADPVPPRQLRPDLPADLETVLLKCLAKDPERRYATARDLADDLRAFGEGRAIRARRPTLGERAARWLARQRFTPGFVVGAILIAALVVGWFALLVAQLRDPATIPLTIAEDPNHLSGEAGFTAELLHADSDKPVLPPLSVPMTTPVQVAHGRYRLRVSRPGWLSATHDVRIPDNYSKFYLYVRLPDAPGGRVEGAPLLGINLLSEGRDLPRPHLWQERPGPVRKIPPDPLPQPLAGALLVRPVQTGRGHDLITLSAAGPLLQHATIRRLIGATGKLLWERKMDDPKRTSPTWSGYLRPTDHALPHVAPVGDDLLFADRWAPAILCLSGRTGEVRWVCGGPGAEQAKPAPGAAGTGAAGQPLVCEMGAGQRGIVVPILPAPRASWELWGVAAATGRRLWRSPLPGSSQTERAFEAFPQPALATVAGRSVVVCLAGGCLVGIDPRSGQPAWPPRRLPFRPVHPPRFADLDGGNTDVLLLHAPEPGQLTLTAWSLASGRTLWEQTWPGVPEPADPRETFWPHEHQPDWPLVADLDGDGRPVVVVRQAVFQEDFSYSFHRSKETPPVECMDLLALDGQTGRLRWQRRLGRARKRWDQPSWLRLLVGPVIDAQRPLIAVSTLVRWHPRVNMPRELYVDALSGRTGESLWWMRRPLRTNEGENDPSGKVARPSWWAADPKGPPLLVVPLVEALGTGKQTLVLDLDGRLLHTVPGLFRAEAVDLDGDGREELLGLGVEDTVRERRRSWSVIAGWAPAVVAAGTPEEVEKDDPRQRIPLPWSRNLVLASLQSGLPFRQWREPLLVMIPLIVVGVALILVGRARLRRGRSPATQDPERRRRQRWHRRVALLIGGLVLASILLIAGLWLWLVRGELAPGERYLWRGWPYQLLSLWVLLFGVCYFLFYGGLLAIRLVRRSKGISAGKEA